MPMAKVYVVRLSAQERTSLAERISRGTVSAQVNRAARVLLKVDQGTHGPGWNDADTANALEISDRTVSRIRQRYCQHGLAGIERRTPCRTTPRKLDGKQEAHLIALACGPVPEGYARWSLRLLAERFVVLEALDGDQAVSYETVRRMLKKTNSSPG
jgi:transposase